MRKNGILLFLRITNRNFALPKSSQKKMKQDEQPLSGNHPSKKKKSLTGLIVTLCLLLALAVGGGGTYAYLKYQAGNEAEERAYHDLELSYASSDYRAFLEHYPASPHAADVEERMRRLQIMERDWTYIERSNRKNDFVAFKNKYQNPLYDRLCDHKIDSLDWVMARLEESPEAYLRYMEQHPDGQYYTEAVAACKEIEDQEITPEEEDEVRVLLNDFFSAFGRNASEELREYVAPRMKRFLNSKNVTSDEVIRIIRNMFNEHIRSCTFQSASTSVEKETDEVSHTPLFKVNGTVTQDIDRDNEGKRHGTYRFSAEVDKNYRLSSLVLTEMNATEPEP